MSTVEPLRHSDDIKNMLDYYRERKELRNCCLISLGLYSALRVSDLLSLRWDDIFDFKRNKFRDRIYITEKKLKNQSALR